MDGHHFDRVVQAMGHGATRRRVLAVLGGLLAAGLREATGKRRRAKSRDRHQDRRTDHRSQADKKKKCAPCKKKKHGKCKGKQPDGTSCPGGTCHSGQCLASPSPAPPPPVTLTCGTGGPCLVFVTSTTHTGNLQGTAATGLAGADAICQGLATAAGLPGTYLAWLSDLTGWPSTRFPTHSTGPYQLVNGTTIAANWTDLTDGTLAAPINVTETGVGISDPDALAWTNTQTNGTLHDALRDCVTWTKGTAPEEGRLGGVTNSDHKWTVRASGTCGNDGHLYCFQQS